ncbi:MAG: EcsC family protein [Candidatus Hatepunaea meridiana]|nr:EcsC family protein [Candidatus Hatepunaea meridiana]
MAISRKRITKALSNQIEKQLSQLFMQGIKPEVSPDRIDEIIKKNPRLSNGDLAEILINRAKRKTAMSGCISSLTLTGSEALIALPDITQLLKAGGIGGVISSISADIVITVKIQMQLIFDVAHLYRAPYDLDDYEDIWMIFATALGTKGVEQIGDFSQNVYMELARDRFKQWISEGIGKSIKIWIRTRMIPIIARLLTQKYITRLIPVLNIAIGTVSNYSVTNNVGNWSKINARIRADTLKTVDEIINYDRRNIELLAGLVFLTVTTDEALTINSVIVYNQVIKRLNLTSEEREDLERFINSEMIQEEVFKRLKRKRKPDLRNSLFELALLTKAASTLNATSEDHKFLRSVAESTNVNYREIDLIQRIRLFKK